MSTQDRHAHLQMFIKHDEHFQQVFTIAVILLAIFKGLFDFCESGLR